MGQWGQAPLAVWKSYKKDRYKQATEADIAKAFEGRKVRFGAYGNPSALPIQLIETITRYARGFTGYFHDWHLMPKERAKAYGAYFMASTDTESSLAKAQKLGLRTFHVSARKPKDSILCPSVSHKTQCVDCLLCSGNSKRAKSIYIAPHGTQTTKHTCLLYTSPSPRDGLLSRMPSSA